MAVKFTSRKPECLLHNAIVQDLGNGVSAPASFTGLASPLLSRPGEFPLTEPEVELACFRCVTRRLLFALR